MYVFHYSRFASSEVSAVSEEDLENWIEANQGALVLCSIPPLIDEPEDRFHN